MLVVIAIILFVLSAFMKKRYPTRSHKLLLAGIYTIVVGVMIDFIVFCIVPILWTNKQRPPKMVVFCCSKNNLFAYI